MQAVDVKEFAARRRVTDNQLQVFLTGLDAVLMQWTALNLVTEHTDATAAQALRSYLVAWFTEVGEVYSDELEDYFDAFFLEARFAAIEDGSQKEVADALHLMYCECCENNDSSVRMYTASLEAYRAAGVAQMCTFERGADELDSDDDAAVDDVDDAAEEVPEAPVIEPKPKSRGKNTYVNSGGGWKTVTRR
jgi:pre-rRNA-processing protein TSR2